MPGTLYDHAVALVVVGALFMFGVVVLPNTSYVNLLYVDEQQLRNRALDSLESMLLDVGYPENWGTTTNFSQNDVERFGLALTNSSSQYILDPDKVQRLVQNNSLGYIDYGKLRELLGLQGYGFKIMVEPIFNVSVRDLAPSQPNNITYEVKVAYRDMKPIPNALVRALIFYSVKVGEEGDEEIYRTHYIEENLLTNSLGTCTLQQTVEGEVSCIFVVWDVQVASLSVLTATSKGDAPSDVAQINMIGDYIILTKPKNIPNGAVKIQDIIVLSGNGDIILNYTGTGTDEDTLNWGSLDEWSKEFPGLRDGMPAVIILDATVPQQGSGREGKLVVASPYFNLEGWSLNYGRVPPGATATLERSVKIAGLDYVFRLVLWKET